VKEETYIVRVFRRGAVDGVELVGVVESPGTGWQRAFRSADEMKDIVSAPRPKLVVGRRASPACVTPRRISR
jgi:hypothetical protein